jgi:hypothetical protein
MAVNFLAPFLSRGGLVGSDDGVLSFERELRVAGVRSRVGPTLDAVLESAAGTIAIEVKLAEPWRDTPGPAFSPQYHDPAAKVSAKTRQAIDAIRGGELGYRCLDAAQLIKHLLGIHTALDAGLIQASNAYAALLAPNCDRPLHRPV